MWLQQAGWEIRRPSRQCQNSPGLSEVALLQSQNTHRGCEESGKVIEYNMQQTNLQEQFLDIVAGFCRRCQMNDVVFLGILLTIL